MEMSIKWRNPFFSHNGAVLKWFVAKEWINVYFFKGSSLDDPAGLFIPTDNEEMRTIRLIETDKVPGKTIADLVRRAVALQEAEKS